jgi:hypothetical protein
LIPEVGKGTIYVVLMPILIKLSEQNMNSEKQAIRSQISINELAHHAFTEIIENLSDAELNGVTGGLSMIAKPIKEFGCPTCRSGYDPRFDDKILDPIEDRRP